MKNKKVLIIISTIISIFGLYLLLGLICSSHDSGIRSGGCDESAPFFCKIKCSSGNGKTQDGCSCGF